MVLEWKDDKYGISIDKTLSIFTNKNIYPVKAIHKGADIYLGIVENGKFRELTSEEYSLTTASFIKIYHDNKFLPLRMFCLQRSAVCGIILDLERLLECGLVSEYKK